MTTAGDERDDGQWRDPERLPLAELDRALATYSFDGQVDDPILVRGDAEAGDPDPDTVEGRALRPSPEGRQGPV